ncbi:MAG: hypothetical protein EOO38_09360 [Cytophagaceae bacterium]|nr:MAG: hypothetical protein EOO38_09360 [Cytophagaceae bacterium]
MPAEGVIGWPPAPSHLDSWPKEQLLALPPDTQVELCVSLSYLIKPNPSARGTSSKFHYPSRRLRFDVPRPIQSCVVAFMWRLFGALKFFSDRCTKNLLAAYL